MFPTPESKVQKMKKVNFAEQNKMKAPSAPPVLLGLLLIVLLSSTPAAGLNRLSYPNIFGGQSSNGPSCKSFGR